MKHQNVSAIACRRSPSTRQDHPRAPAVFIEGDQVIGKRLSNTNNRHQRTVPSFLGIAVQTTAPAHELRTTGRSLPSSNVSTSVAPGLPCSSRALVVSIPLAECTRATAFHPAPGGSATKLKPPLDITLDGANRPTTGTVPMTRSQGSWHRRVFKRSAISSSHRSGAEGSFGPFRRVGHRAEHPRHYTFHFAELLHLRFERVE